MSDQGDPRAGRILELELMGYSKKQIAEELNIDEKTVYNIKRRDTYIGLLEDNRNRYNELLNTMSESDIMTIKLEVLKERGRMERSGSKIMADAALRLHEGRLTPDPEVCAECMMSRRKNVDAVLQALKLTPAQWKVLEQFVLPEPGAPYLRVERRKNE